MMQITGYAMGRDVTLFSGIKHCKHLGTPKIIRAKPGPLNCPRLTSMTLIYTVTLWDLRYFNDIVPLNMDCEKLGYIVLATH